MDIKYARERLTMLVFSCPIEIEKNENNFITNVIRHKNSSFWRFIEIGNSVLDNFEQEKIMSGMILLRSAIETVSVLIYIDKKINNAIEQNIIHVKLEKRLREIVFNNATAKKDSTNFLIYDGESEHPIDPEILTETRNIGNFICASGMNNSYESLCELTHPNYYGTSGFYSKIDENNFIRFGPQIDIETTQAYLKLVGDTFLNLLNKFEETYNSINDCILKLRHIPCSSHLHMLNKES